MRSRVRGSIASDSTLIWSEIFSQVTPPFVLRYTPERPPARTKLASFGSTAIARTEKFSSPASRRSHVLPPSPETATTPPPHRPHDAAHSFPSRSRRRLSTTKPGNGTPFRGVDHVFAPSLETYTSPPLVPR